MEPIPGPREDKNESFWARECGGCASCTTSAVGTSPRSTVK
jgi:hypothetical protein